ncbi:MAG: DUF262 domain-containing protein [Methylococcaceae bacterium]
MSNNESIEVTDKVKKNELLDQEINTTRNGLSTDRLDMSFGEIISMYERDEIIINPDFQRLFRWDNEQQTRFIESLLLGIPIPPIFVAEISQGDDSGKWELVDGLQRVSTVLSFFGELKTLPDKNNWTLSEGGLIKALNGYSLNSLPLRYQLNIRRAACRIEIIKWNSMIDMRYELFKRINSSGEPITEQELRNCIFRPQSNKFNDFLKDLAATPNFKELTSPTDKQIEQLYLQELVLRFFALYEIAKSDSPAKQKINEVISSYMTSYMQEAIKDNAFDYEGSKRLFVELIELLSPIGKNLFKGTNNTGPFSTSIYDIVMVGIALSLNHYKEMNSADLAKFIEDTKNDTEFTQLRGAGIATNSKGRVAKRIELTRKFFKPTI